MCSAGRAVRIEPQRVTADPHIASRKRRADPDFDSPVFNEFILLIFASNSGKKREKVRGVPMALWSRQTFLPLLMKADNPPALFPHKSNAASL
jgi:hypothetical protein